MKLTDQDKMPFGAHKDKPMEKVPADYLLWLRDDMLDKGGPTTSYGIGVLNYVNENSLALCQEARDYDPKHKFSR